MTAAPQLRKINLNYCIGLTGKLELANDSLSQLEDINLNYSYLSLENLQTILRAAPQLKKISLSECNDLNGTLELANDSLLQLEDIDLNNSRLSLENLQAIFNAAPNLTPQCKQSIANKIAQANQVRASGGAGLTSALVSKTEINEDDSEIILSTSTLINGNATTVIPAKNENRPDDIDFTNQTHDPYQMKDFEPNKKSFEFKGTNTTKNQGMIIEKLSQYLTLTQQNVSDIPTLQDGICKPLSYYFTDIEKPQWDTFVDKALAWDGRVDTLDDGLQKHFDRLFDEYVQRYQFISQSKEKYIGDNLDLFLTTQETCILGNPWHAIAIKRSAEGWLVYDPNCVLGCLEVTAHDLLKILHGTIGTLVSIIKADIEQVECKINDPDAFIAQGGLLALCFNYNSNNILSKLTTNHTYSKDALDGLLLRSAKGKPAWAIGLASYHTSIKQFTQTLINQFELNNPDAIKQLEKGLWALTPAQKDELIKTLVRGLNTEQGANQRLQSKLIATIRKSINKPQYVQRLRTWDKTATLVSNTRLYFHQCLTSGQKKRLIELDSEQHLDTLRQQLQQQAANTGRPVFYIDNPTELEISQGYIKREGSSNTGDFVKGAAGALHAFLQTNQAQHPLLIVNYDRFNQDDMVKYNSLLDEKPNAVGTDLPAKTQIIGLMNKNKPNRYTGSDFYSRFNGTEDCPLTADQFNAIQSTRTVEIISEKDTETTVINLYHAADWKNQLLGGWVMEGDRYQWKESQLIKAIEKDKPIEIKHGLWGDEAFDRFWNQALSRKMFHEDVVIDIPHGLKLLRPEKETYAWETLAEQVFTIEHGLSNATEARALNPTSLADFYGRYEPHARSDVPGDNRLVQKEGWLRLAQGQTLDVNLTRTLSDDAWAQLLDQCKQFGVKLNIHCAPNVELPASFHQVTIEPTHLAGIPESTINHDLIITSTDTDTTVAMLKKNKAYVVVDISECTSADLLVWLDGKLNQQTLSFDFMQSNGALTTALAENKNIILTGCFSQELLDSLAPLLLERAQSHMTSQLILMTDDTHAGQYVPHRYLHAVSQQEKLGCLPFDKAIIDKLGASLEREPLSKLMARCRYLYSNPSAQSSDNAWIGMNSLPGNTQALTANINRTTSAQSSAEFTQARLAKVNEILASSPYVFLTGLSGVGKSTLVEQELGKNNTLYQTEDQMEAWAKSDSHDKRQILFLDEANLSPRKWSEFEGLFNQPPTLLVNGVLYTLTENHKVMFAGNPVNYGDERQLAPLFQRHGNALLFTPLPPDVIDEQILKPVFAGQAMYHDSIADRILDIYRFICECSTKEILISPRELQMMALLTITRAKHNPEQDIQQISEQISYALAKNLVPPAKRAAFDKRFKPAPILGLTFDSQQNPTEAGNTFLITPSRQHLSQQLADLFNLRQWRREQTNTLNQAQKGGGLGGIIIEGAPGIGKSELVIAALIARGYKEEHDFTKPARSENLFYRMPVSLPLVEKEALLIKAFNEGAVIMIDEINSSPMMERLLNDLLMGKNPKRIDGIIEKPGFMVIGTQNPVTMAGRRTASPALLRRLISTQLPEYTSDEIKIILLAKGINSDEADSMIEAYEETRAFAIKNRLSPAPNFRHLIRLANEHLKAMTEILHRSLPADAVNPLSSTMLTTKGSSGFFAYKRTNHESGDSEEDLPLKKAYLDKT